MHVYHGEHVRLQCCLKWAAFLNVRVCIAHIRSYITLGLTLR